MSKPIVGSPGALALGGCHEKTQKLKELHSLLGPTEFSKRFPGHTAQQVFSRAKYLGLKVSAERKHEILSKGQIVLNKSARRRKEQSEMMKRVWSSAK
jgi:hypothetical protein